MNKKWDDFLAVQAAGLKKGFIFSSRKLHGEKINGFLSAATCMDLKAVDFSMLQLARPKNYLINARPGLMRRGRDSVLVHGMTLSFSNVLGAASLYREA